MSTGSLLKRWKDLLSCEDSYEGSEKEHDCEPILIDSIEFKESPQWRIAYQDVKKILAIREHIPRPAEKKARRLEKAAQRKLGERRSGR
ncbi:hypothetical protein N9891_00475 [bacterium]|nr:hypothetical protein [bacterium]